jgi:hypothetical protein
MNKLCISKLLQVVEDDLVPSDFHRHEDDSTAAPRPQRPPFSEPQAMPTVFHPTPVSAPTSSFHQPSPTPPPHYRTPPPPQSPGGPSY